MHVWVRTRLRLGQTYVSFVRRTLKRQLHRLGLRGVEVSMCLVGDRAMRTLNRTWRGKDASTDVLSFPAGTTPVPVGKRRLLGDVIVSLDTTRRRAGPRRQDIERELTRYLAHGVLHLLGYDHHAPGPRRRMARMEKRLLGRTGMLDSR
ncbi:MAG: rRNA maturation RNase YbeY [Myxococcaceae bacterium]